MNRLLLVTPLRRVLVSGNAHAGSADCKVSLAQYQKLQTGMTYPKVVAVLGCDGSELSQVEMGGFKTVMYMWDGEGSLGANMNIMLQNGKLILRAQFGLK